MHLRIAVLLTIFAATLGVACGRDLPREANATVLKEGTPPPAHCDVASFQSRAREILAAAPGTCSTADDCECYAGQLFGTCGGVTDRATADRLNALTGEASNAGCPSRTNCARRQCTPSCVQGRCQ